MLARAPRGTAFFSASDLLRELRRFSFAFTYRTTSIGSVQAYERSAQPMAFLRKNSFDAIEGSMQA